jgi:Cu2+-exporting ATPase
VTLTDQLLALSRTLARARRTLRIVRQNLAWAVIYNVVAVPLAIAGYMPAWAAGLGMAASSLLVVLNALRLAGGRDEQVLADVARQTPKDFNDNRGGQTEQSSKRLGLSSPSAAKVA